MGEVRGVALHAEADLLLISLLYHYRSFCCCVLNGGRCIIKISVYHRHASYSLNKPLHSVNVIPFKLFFRSCCLFLCFTLLFTRCIYNLNQNDRLLLKIVPSTLYESQLRIFSRNQTFAFKNTVWRWH
jgi:hypothetical protein